MPVLWTAANERLINLRGAAVFTTHLLDCMSLQNGAQPLQDEPSRFLSQFQVACNLVARDAILAVAEHPQRDEPLVETDRTILENRVHLDRELLAAGIALPT